MAKWQVGKGLDEWLSMIGNLSTMAPDVMGEAIYKGAGIVADAVKQNIRSLPTGKQEDGGITKPQKQGLIDGLGIATQRDDSGYINVKIGMDGYNSSKTKKYPNGQPNAMIARAVESGTSFRKKHPFIAPAVNRTKSKAENVMKTTIETKISQIGFGKE